MKYQSLIFSTQKEVLDLEEIIHTIEKANKDILVNKSLSLLIGLDEKSKSIGVKNISELSMWNSLKSDTGIKLAGINQAHLLTEEAQNSLLKILEEPSNNTIIILITNNTEELLNTIRSRCLIINLQEDIQITQFQNILFMNFFERSTYFSQISKQDRIECMKLISQLLKDLVNKRDDYERNSFTITTKAIQNVYNGIKGGTNIKISLNYINLLLESLKSL